MKDNHEPLQTPNVMRKYKSAYIPFGFIIAGCDVEPEAQCIEGDANLSQPFAKNVFTFAIY